MTMTDAEPDRASPKAAGKLAGRAVLVTGGTRGIGAAICASLAGQGASVAAGYSGDTDRAKAFVGDFARKFAPARVTVHRGNVASPADCQRVVHEVIAEHGRLDILVNNAGVTVDKLAVDLTTADWDKVLSVNLSGAFHMAQAALAHMLERGTGRIINVSSLAGEIGNIGQANYAASKSGLFGLTKALAREAAFLLSRSGRLTPDTIGITVNAVTPGFIETEMLEHIPAKALSRLTAQIPCGRLGRPAEVARIVHFLAADASSYITGQVWGVNGGLDM
jgi:NAD(P)-dependent dehydrogenase (short-subunit alcohol dehydrogenase family)